MIVKRYKCKVCGYIYSPLRGEPGHGVPEGTAFEDLPDDYVCPLCGVQPNFATKRIRLFLV